MSEVALTETIDCPYCSELIKKTAKKCRHCGEIIDQQMRDIESMKRDKSASQVFMNAGGGSSAAVYSQPRLKRFQHWLHIILSLLSGGLWIPVYLLLYFARNKNVYY